MESPGGLSSNCSQPKCSGVQRVPANATGATSSSGSRTEYLNGSPHSMIMKSKKQTVVNDLVTIVFIVIISYVSNAVCMYTFVDFICRNFLF